MIAFNRSIDPLYIIKCSISHPPHLSSGIAVLCPLHHHATSHVITIIIPQPLPAHQSFLSPYDHNIIIIRRAFNSTQRTTHELYLIFINKSQSKLYPAAITIAPPDDDRPRTKDLLAPHGVGWLLINTLALALITHISLCCCSSSFAQLEGLLEPNPKIINCLSHRARRKTRLNLECLHHRMAISLCLILSLHGRVKEIFKRIVDILLVQLGLCRHRGHCVAAAQTRTWLLVAHGRLRGALNPIDRGRRGRCRRLLLAHSIVSPLRCAGGCR